MSSGPRSVKIGENERGGWSSERPRRPGEAERPPRPADVSVRGRVLSPSDSLRYSPGSLLLIACADPATRDAFCARVIADAARCSRSARCAALLEGRVGGRRARGEGAGAARRRRQEAARRGPHRRGRARGARPRRARALRAAGARAQPPAPPDPGRGRQGQGRRGGPRGARRAAHRARRGRPRPGGFRDLAAARRRDRLGAQADRVRPARRATTDRGTHRCGRSRVRS